MAFPRLQIAFASAMVLGRALFLPGSGRILIPAAMIVACGYQLWRLYPCTPLNAVEMKLAERAADAVKVLSANVLMENKRHDLLLDVIATFDPDILLLMETDQNWVDAIEPMLARYPTVIRAPQSNHYGIVFATRLAVDEARIVRLTVDDTPSVFAQMKGPDGATFRFVGLHPRPPVPRQSTRERDAQTHAPSPKCRRSAPSAVAAPRPATVGRRGRRRSTDMPSWGGRDACAALVQVTRRNPWRHLLAIPAFIGAAAPVAARTGVIALTQGYGLRF